MIQHWFGVDFNNASILCLAIFVIFAMVESEIPIDPKFEEIKRNLKIGALNFVLAYLFVTSSIGFLTDLLRLILRGKV